MTAAATISSRPSYRESAFTWGCVALSILLFAYVYRNALVKLERVWGLREEYSYGYLIPVICGFLIWQHGDRLRTAKFTGSWTGSALLAVSLLILAVGQISTLDTLAQYALLGGIWALAWSYMGTQAIRIIFVPLLMLALMVPIPSYLFGELSQVLQLLSSKLGVAAIRLFGISVHLQGNVIDLGSMKLQVVEACSGLRYLFPLMTLGVIAAYFFRAEMWKRWVLFLSTIPITLIMNSLRIALIGVTVEYGGRRMAEGLLHDLEGWVVFMACTALLVAEMWLLVRVGGVRRSFADVFAIQLPAPRAQDEKAVERDLPKAFLAATLLLITAAMIPLLAPTLTPEKGRPHIERESFARFPMKIDEWQGRQDRLDPAYLPILNLDDYVLADYADGRRNVINLHVAWYASQADGTSAHSPRACIPGDGWEISNLTRRTIDGAVVGGVPLEVARAVIQKGEARQLVYFWFLQNGMAITGEYSVKLQILRDAIFRHRTDGAVVRLVTPLLPSERVEDVDARLSRFAARVLPELKPFVPGLN
jgi:exosortase D (VPLPA-CTERM-specific)